MPWQLPSWSTFRESDAENRSLMVKNMKSQFSSLVDTLKNQSFEGGGIRSEIALSARNFANLTIQGTKESTLRLLWNKIGDELRFVEDGDDNALFARNHPEAPRRD